MYKNLIIYCVYLKVCYCEAIRDMVAEQMQTSKNMMHSCKIQQHGPPQGLLSMGLCLAMFSISTDLEYY